MASEFHYGRFIPILEGLRTLFLKHGYVGQVDILAKLITLAHLESPDFADRIQFGGVWSSAGSVADAVGLYDSKARDEAQRDTAEAMRLLLRLADEIPRRLRPIRIG